MIKKIGRNKALLLIFGFLIFIGSVRFSHAQEAPLESNQEDSARESTSIIQNLIEVKKDEAEKEASAIRFVAPTYENILKLMWLLDVYKASNPDDIDAYIKVTECNLYKKYYYNDFEWKKIQKATADYFQKYSKNFSNYFEFVQPVYIGRYDFQLKGFRLVNQSELSNVSALQISNTRSFESECPGINVGGGQYSGTVVLKLKNPISIDFIRMPEDLAKKYLDLLEERNGKIEDTKEVYIRYRLRIDDFVEQQALSQLGSVQIMSGRALKVDIFADSELFYPLFSQDYD